MRNDAMDLHSAYDPEGFRRQGHALIDQLADALLQAQSGAGSVLQPIDPEELLASWPRDLPAKGGADLGDWIRRCWEHSVRLHHPGYIGHQVAAPIPLAALVEMASALSNNGMAVYEMGQAPTVMERRVIQFLAGHLDWDSTADGVLTHGGSLGNLTALLAARQAQAQHDVWSEGQVDPMCVLVSRQAHYCVDRAVRVMGWGADGVAQVGVDRDYRMELADLERCWRQAGERGRRPIAVVASACSTATGSFDPVARIADFCQERGLWLHVDGAHGASYVLSPQLRGRLEGIDRADSVVWDLHKMLALPALNTAVLFREGQRSYEAFAQEASYLFEGATTQDDWFNVGRRTLECTKRGLGLVAWATLAAVGTDATVEHLERTYAQTLALHEMLEAADDFEAAHEPQANILCFRHRPKGVEPGAELDAHQERLRQALLEGGSHYLVQTRLDGALWLRVTLMNPFTSRETLESLMQELRALD